MSAHEVHKRKPEALPRAHGLRVDQEAAGRFIWHEVGVLDT